MTQYQGNVQSYVLEITASARFVCVQKDPSPKCWGLFYAAFNLTKPGVLFLYGPGRREAPHFS
jgi:hypothetical protein